MTKKLTKNDSNLVKGTISFVFHSLAKEFEFCLKFGYSEKATKFEKKFQLKFDVTE